MFLVNPGVVPPLIGYFNFDAKHHISYSLNSTFPATARTISITVFIYTGYCGASIGTEFNFWLWTECIGKIADIKFKRYYCYANRAVAHDSETLQFMYCPSNPKLYLTTDANVYSHTQLQLYAVAYTN